MEKISDYIGKKIDKIKFLEKVTTNKYIIECDCGQVVERSKNNLLKAHRKGNILSCGCMKGFNISQRLTGKISHRKIHFTQEQIDDIINKHKQEISLDTIAKEYGYSQPVIGNLVKKMGFNPKNRRSNLNEHFFDEVDSEIKAYWLGYLAADGTIRVRDKATKDGYVRNRGNSIHLKLSTADEEHLKKFRDVVCPNSVLKYSTSIITTRKGTISKSENVILNLYSNYIVSQIIDKGVGPRKTFTLGKPNIDEKYIKHYIRGFFDGDGCCCVGKRKGKLRNELLVVKYTFACASVKLRTFISEELKKTLDIDTSTYGNITLSILGGLTASKKFFHYLYDDATIYLERKYNKGLEFIDYVPLKNR